MPVSVFSLSADEILSALRTGMGGGPPLFLTLLPSINPEKSTLTSAGFSALGRVFKAEELID